ncbi:Uncharacterised protein [Enterobacter hormaechei]|nr:Uncharacterised protein [Enterobacter hormaechei]CZV65727.1 Uncharacterised protein [Enterobacter hormaechei]CZY59672.1 Uncharacterised protein [Enterobacter hormaechei]SAB16317.1 Uncharacterised protein [Enterobacter hormaechei]SAB28059.1 Uncharacterised protein [Enterobacter hormaechei]
MARRHAPPSRVDPSAASPSSDQAGPEYPAAHRRRLSDSKVHGHTRSPPHLPPRRRPDRDTDRSACYSPGSPASRQQTGCTPATATRDRNPPRRHASHRTPSLPGYPRTDTLPATPASPSASHPPGPDTHAAHQTPPASKGSRLPASQTGGRLPSARRHASQSPSRPDAAPPFSARSRRHNRPSPHRGPVSASVGWSQASTTPAPLCCF